MYIQCYTEQLTLNPAGNQAQFDAIRRFRRVEAALIYLYVFQMNEE